MLWCDIHGQCLTGGRGFVMSSMFRLPGFGDACESLFPFGVGYHGLVCLDCVAACAAWIQTNFPNAERDEHHRMREMQRARGEMLAQRRSNTPPDSKHPPLSDLGAVIYRMQPESAEESRIDRDPRWASLGHDDRRDITSLIERGSGIKAISRYQEATGRGLIESKAAVADFVKELAMASLPRCPNCGKRLRTVKAQQCFKCGADWHQSTANMA